MDGKGMKVAYSVSERAGKSYWTRIGVGYVNKDGSWNMKLDAFPIAPATLQIRDWEPRDDQRDPAALPPASAHIGNDDFAATPVANARRARQAPAADPFA